MKLSEYMEQYGRIVLTYNERETFGIPSLKKGWKKRYAEFEIPDSVVPSLVATLGDNKTKKQRKKANQKLDFAVAYEKTNDQLLYLMENANGLIKVGISVDPIKRARSLTTASGVAVNLLGVWRLDRNARKIEGQLHKNFSKYRLEGEWFSPGSITTEKVEERISCKWERLLLNLSIEDRRLQAKQMDSFTYSHIKVETEKAILFVIDGLQHWCPKSRIYHMNTDRREIKVAKGQFSREVVS